MYDCASVCATRRMLLEAMLALTLLVPACSSSDRDEPHAVPADLPRGQPGSHVWFDSSVSLELKESYFFDTWGPNAPPPSSGTSCWTLTRDALTAEQQTKLDAIVLAPLTAECTSDGYSYDELTVTDTDGTAATYRDTGCESRKLDGAEALLPKNAFNAFPHPVATSCAD
jgi:hypothetical protein